MLDIGWSEFLIIGLVALVVIGPRELPGALRTAGRYVARARSLARDFRDGLDDIARENDLDDIGRSMTGDKEWFDVEDQNSIKGDQSAIPSDGKVDDADVTDKTPGVDDEELWDEADVAAADDEDAKDAEVDVPLPASTNKDHRS
ncbi:MAG: Sec-independent protein translocase protein TatB [Alphaproteobacteria bacterium]|jgi:sec-independent protein translocase protein TatB